MAKGKSTEKSKRDESTSQTRTTTRKKRVASSPASPIEEKPSKTSTKVRVRKSKSDDLKIVDSSHTPKQSKRVVRNKEAATPQKNLLPANDAPKGKDVKSVSNIKKDAGEVRPVKKTARKRSESTEIQNVDDLKKKTVAKRTDVSSEKKKEKSEGKTPRNTVKTDFGVKSASESKSTSRKPVGKKERNKASDVPVEKIVVTKVKRNGKTSIVSEQPVEATPTEKKKQRAGRAKSQETRHSESNVAVVASDEKSEVKRSRKQNAKTTAVESEETKAVAKPSRRKTKSIQKSLKSQETVEKDGDDLVEVASETKEERAKEASETSVKPKKKRVKKADATDTVEKRNKNSRQQKQDDGAETASVEDGDSDQKAESASTKKEEAGRSDAESSQSSRQTARRKSSSSSQTPSSRVLSSPNPDYLVLSAVNSFWLCAQWVVSDSNLNRVRSAMGRLWHTSEPILRVYRVDKSSQYTTIRREHVSDVVVKLPVRIWYAPVDNPPSSFMVELGYLSRDGEFFTLSSSGVVETSAHFIDDSTPLPPPIAPRWGIAGSTQRSSFGTASLETKQSPTDDSDFSFRRAEPTDSFHAFGGVSLKVGAEVVIKGRVTPGAILKIRDERVVPKPNGFFAARLELPERRHVYPIVATSYDGSEIQTIILAIDRNTKTLETVFRDDEE